MAEYATLNKVKDLESKIERIEHQLRDMDRKLDRIIANLP